MTSLTTTSAPQNHVSRTESSGSIPDEFIVHFAPAEHNGVKDVQRNQPVKRSFIRRAAEKVWTAVKWIFKIAVGVGLFVFNSSFFAVGFIVGVVFNKQIKPAIDKITLVWKRQSLVVAILVGIGGFLALPVTLAAAASLYGAVIGSKLSEDAQKKEEKQNPPQHPNPTHPARA